jgi:hypothetical protein
VESETADNDMADPTAVTVPSVPGDPRYGTLGALINVCYSLWGSGDYGPGGGGSEQLGACANQLC